MKFVVLAALVAVAACAKLPGGQEEFVEHHQEIFPQRPQFAIIRDDRLAPEGAFYNTDVETENGIIFSENGHEGSLGQSNAEGSVSYTSPEGDLIEVTYVADELGFRAVGAHIPTPPPLPAHVYELLRIAEEQRAAGITFE
ncbi:cuticle protein AM1159-like [Homarus americanus]|uniref:cuticle protein AM1159-like n=1 Tax=Homarus americanus TaxID=6706 RepID=UPI001C45B029|nr:cuticle protein AM1159-like [Homarus americanus]